MKTQLSLHHDRSLQNISPHQHIKLRANMHTYQLTAPRAPQATDFSASKWRTARAPCKNDSQQKSLKNILYPSVNEFVLVDPKQNRVHQQLIFHPSQTTKALQTIVNKNVSDVKPRFDIKPTDSKQTIENRVQIDPRSQVGSNEPKKPKILSRNVRITQSFMEEFQTGKVLGKGRFGQVFVGRHLATGTMYAVKQISLEKASTKLIDRLIWEIKIQSFLNHANCLQVYKCVREGPNLYLVLELAETNLFELLRQKKFFTEKETAYYLRQTIQALLHMHEHGIIHRDLKPENLVLVNNVVKLADYGWSVSLGPTGTRTTFCGTLDYFSPEIVLGSSYDETVDVWSVGVLCYELSTGHAPFDSRQSRQETYRNILNVELKFPKHLSVDLRNFISRILARNPENRMTLKQALSHPWMTQFDFND